jgi:hypothetical protein
VALKWQQKIQLMTYDELHAKDFLERVKRSADYFADQLRSIFAKPLELSAKVETGNKQARRRLDNALPDLRQAVVARRYLLLKIAELGYSVDNYLHEKQMSMLDALDADSPSKSKGGKTAGKRKKRQK